MEMNDDYYIINKNLRVTPNHRLYSNGKWTSVENLRTGDHLLGFDGSEVVIISLEKVIGEKVMTYDINIKSLSIHGHNYITNGVIACTKSTTATNHNTME